MPVSTASLELVPVIPPGLRLQWEAAQQAHVLLYPEGMVRLNQSAASILQLCDGRRSVAGIIADLERSFGASGLSADVLTFVSHALQKHWLRAGP